MLHLKWQKTALFEGARLILNSEGRGPNLASLWNKPHNAASHNRDGYIQQDFIF